MSFPFQRWACMVASVIIINSAANAAGADSVNGKKLYDSKCFACHDTSIHTRENKIIFSKKALLNRVKMCEVNANAQWNEQQIIDVVEHLNTTYYKYE